MKRLLSILLVCLMAVPFGMIASVGVSAEDADAPVAAPQSKVVYLSDNGSDNNDGMSADKPKKTITQSYAALGAEGGEIVIVGTFTHVANFIAPVHTGTVTVRGADANARYVMKGNYRYFLGGPTVFDDFTLEANAGTFLLVCLFNDFTATDTFSIERKKDVLLLVGGQSDKDYKKNRDFGAAKDVAVTLNGGNWQEVVGGMRQGLNVPTPDGKTVTKKAADFADYELTLNIGGNVTIAKLFAFNRSVTTDLVAPGSHCTINLTGGVITHFAGVNDQKSKRCGYEDGITVNIFKTYDINASFNGDPNADSNRYNSTGVFCGFSGESLYEESTVKFERLINGVLVVEKDAYVDVVGSGKVNIETFAEVKTVDSISAPDDEVQQGESEGTNPGNNENEENKENSGNNENSDNNEQPESNVETPADTAAATDTSADTGTVSNNAGSGNIGLVIAIVILAVVVVGVVVVLVIKKKK